MTLCDERRDRRADVELDLLDVDRRELGDQCGEAAVEGRFVGGTDPEREPGDDGTGPVADVRRDIVDDDPFERESGHGTGA